MGQAQKGFSPDLPQREGWWLWLEKGEEKPVRLYIVGDERHTEVADDSVLAEQLDCDEDEVSNYWEMTSCREMGGRWRFDGPGRA